MTQGTNKIWEHVSKVGRNKLFETPEILWNEAVKYFEYQNSRVLNEKQFVGKDGTERDKPHKPPFSKEGLHLYLGTCDSYLRTFKSTQKDKNTTISKEFLTVLSRIDKVLFVQQYDGAATGQYNSNIVKAKLHIVDKHDLTTDGAPVSISVNVQDKALQDKLNKE